MLKLINVGKKATFLKYYVLGKLSHELIIFVCYSRLAFFIIIPFAYAEFSVQCGKSRVPVKRGLVLSGHNIPACLRVALPGIMRGSASGYSVHLPPLVELWSCGKSGLSNWFRPLNFL